MATTLADARPVTTVPRVRRRPRVGVGLGLGTAVLYLSLIVLIPLGAVVWKSGAAGGHTFWADITTTNNGYLNLLLSLQGIRNAQNNLKSQEQNYRLHLEQ